jgi:hypothetical protein
MATWFAYLGIASGSTLDLAPVVGSLILAFLGFCAPMILTEGWDKPFPRASHLALIGRATQRMAAVLGMASLCLPSLFWLAGGR